MTASKFQKAVKYQAKGRVALVGPAGSGKSYTMLLLAKLLAGNGKIAAIDTEHGSLSKYADLFDFDVIELDSFSPQNFLESLELAEKENYAVFCCDSLSHFWVGKDGALEFVDNAARRSKDNMGGWKDFRPHERKMVDAILASKCHVICTMRTKNEYVNEERIVDGKKKNVRVKIGLAPVQRDGLEYEFDLVGTLDDENTMIIDKTRCSAYAGKAIPKPGPREWQTFANWLQGAERQSAVPQDSAPLKPQIVPPSAPPVVIDNDDIPTVMGGTYEPGPNPATEKVQAAVRNMANSNRPWNTRGEMKLRFQQALADLSKYDDDPNMPMGASIYLAELKACGVTSPDQFGINDGEKALECYQRLQERIAHVSEKIATLEGATQ